jgi:hypothetical protein
MAAIAEGKLSNDAGKDDQRNAVADAAGGDLLTQPHQEHGATGERNHRGNAEIPARINDHVALAFKPDGNTIGLQRRQNDSAIAGILVDLLAALLALFLELLKMRTHGRHQLNDDRGRDIRHDVEREDGHTAKRATSQTVDPAKDA